jgi:N-methylhydantoinase A
MAAAEAIIRVANSRMAGAIRLVSVERGHDPNKFAAMPFGGGGALHAGALMKEVGLMSALVPRFPGINSALGCTIADMRHDFVQTVNGILDTLNIADLDQRICALAQEGFDLLEQAGVAFSGTECLFELDMSYQGQTHTVDVPLSLKLEDGRTGVTVDDIKAAFETRYAQVYGRPLDGIPIRVLNLRVSAVGYRPKFDLSLLAPKGDADMAAAHTGMRNVWVDNGWNETAIFDRLDLPVGAIVPGPAILEQPDATIFIEPDLQGEIDRFGNVIITRKGEG